MHNTKPFKYPKKINVNGLIFKFDQTTSVDNDKEVAWYRASNHKLDMDLWVAQENWATVFFDDSNCNYDKNDNFIFGLSSKLQEKLIPKKTLKLKEVTGKEWQFNKEAMKLLSNLVVSELKKKGLKVKKQKALIDPVY